GVAVRRAENDVAKLEIQIREEVNEAARRAQRSRAAMDVFEGGGMLERAETALRVAEKSYRAGAVSLLELLEAQRTYLETRAEYLRAVYEQRLSTIDLMHAIGSER